MGHPRMDNISQSNVLNHTTQAFNPFCVSILSITALISLSLHTHLVNFTLSSRSITVGQWERRAFS